MAKSRALGKDDEIKNLKSKLTETENKLRAKEEENLKLEVYMGKLHFYLETADSVRTKLMEDVKKLRDELDENKKVLEGKDNKLKSMEKEHSQDYGDLMAECMVRKQQVIQLTKDKQQLERKLNEPKMTLGFVQGGIVELKRAVFKLEKIVEEKTKESLGLEKEVGGKSSKPTGSQSSSQTSTSQASISSRPEPQKPVRRSTRALSSAKVAAHSKR